MISDFINLFSGYSLVLISSWGYWAIIILSVLDRVTVALIPAEVLLPLFGFLASRGDFSLWILLPVVTLANLLGEAVLYWISAIGGRLLLEKYGKYFLVKKHDLEHLDKLFEKYGTKIVLYGRLIPAVRSIVAFPAGIARVRFDRFLIFSFLGLIPYNFLLLYLGFKAVDSIVTFRKYWDSLDLLVIGVLLAAVTWYIYRHIKRKHLIH